MQTGQSGVKGGNKPQSTPHPSCTHKNSMSASLPCSVPPLLFPLALSSVAFSSIHVFGISHSRCAVDPESESKLIKHVNRTSLVADLL